MTVPEKQTPLRYLLFGTFGICMVSMVMITRWLRNPCVDEDAHSVLHTTYNRHLEQMRTAIGALRGEKSNDNPQVGVLEAQIQQLQAQLYKTQGELEQQLKLSQVQKNHVVDQHQAAVQAFAAQTHRMEPTLERLPLPSDAIDWSKRTKRAPTFEELYAQLYGVNFTEASNVVMTFVNPYNKVPHMTYPHSSVWLEGDKILNRLLEELKPDVPRFIVEAGSMHGGSAIRMSMELDKHGYKDVPYLCIDPWTGDLNMWLNRIVWDHLDVRDGRATTFDQFMLNTKQAIVDKKITSHHIMPFPVSSVIGARWLQATAFQPNIIYLDSAHEVDETYYELCLYWHLLEPGGILMGDDYGWAAVRIDVDRFIKDKQLKLNMFGVYYNWFIKKPKVVA